MNRARPPRHDLPQSGLTNSLAILLFIMFLSACAAQASPADIDVTGTSSPMPAPTEAILEITETVVASPLPAKIEMTKTPSTAAQTPAAKATEPAASLPVAATPTGKAGGEPTPNPAHTGSCPTSAPSRLAVGQTARVVRRLNLRSDPSIDAPILTTSSVGSEVEIIGGSVCAPFGENAYLWWQIRLADGTEGWSVESPLKAAIYYLEPVQ